MPDLWLDVDTAVNIPVNIIALTDDTDFITREEKLLLPTTKRVWI